MTAAATQAQRIALASVQGVTHVTRSDGADVTDAGTAGDGDGPLVANGLCVRLADPSAVSSVLATIRAMPGVMAADSQVAIWNPQDAVAVDPYWPEQWHLHRVTKALCQAHASPQPGSSIGADAAWDYAPMTPEIRIGILDDGISQTAYDLDMNHDQEGLARSAWKTFIDASTGELPPTANDLNPAFNVDPFHGTRVASLAVARTDFSGSGYGIAGISRVGIPISLKIDVQRKLAPSDMIAAIDYGSRMNATGAECAIISNSNGFTTSLLAPTTRKQLAQVNRGAWLRGTFLVAASGNDFRNIDVEPAFTRYPAAFGDIVVAAGATSFAARIWSMQDLFGTFSTAGSTYGSNISVVAPGAGISSMRGDGTISSVDAPDCSFTETGFGEYCGTSFAAPLVAGAAAWLLALQPTLTNDDLRQVLELSATDMGSPGFDPVYGHGQIDLAKAAQMISAPNWIEHGAVGAGTSIPLGDANTHDGTLTLSGTDSPSLDGTHQARRHELIAEARFTQFLGVPLFWIRRAQSKGVDASGVWDEASRLPWGEPDPRGAPGNFYRLVHTYVYELLDLPGQWYPCSPSEAVLQYTVVGQVFPTSVPAGGRAMPLSASPTSNPSRGSIHLAISGIAAGPLRVEVFDVAGRRQARLFEGLTHTSSLVVDWDGRSPGGRAAPGLYVVRLEQPGRRYACRVAYMR